VNGATTKDLWRVSLHGGHSGAYCDHATGSLAAVLEAAVEAGYHTFGVSEHAPRVESRFLYPEEVEAGYDVGRLESEFKAYVHEVKELASAYKGRLCVLCGFEAEVVPDNRYVEVMLGYRERYGFDYMVGSVHYVREVQIDWHKEMFTRAIETCGGLEAMCVAYYEAVAQMVVELRPEVVGHLDLVRKNAGPFGPVDTPRVRSAASETLEVIRAHDCILDLNTAGYRKGLGSPYLAPWLVERAAAMGIGFCFGDDSHGPHQVGLDLDRSRRYLLNNGVTTVTVLTRDKAEVVKRVVPLV
jgi:histidinol-phosphatase (PHP family)